MRPREQYIVQGPDALDPRQLIALVVGTGAGGRSASEISDALLDHFGGLAGLRAAPPAALAAVRGVGEARAVRLHAALALGRRSGPPPTPLAITDPDGAAAILAPRLRGLIHEELHGLYLDRRGRVRHVRCLTRGTDHCTLVDPRQVLQPAVQLGVARIVVAHNHPCGDPRPSDADLRTTRRLVRAAQVLQLQVVDHLIVTEHDVTSLARIGAIPTHDGAHGVVAGCLSPSGALG